MTPAQFRAALDRLGLSQLGFGRLFRLGARTGRRYAQIDALMARHAELKDKRAAARQAARRKVKTPELDASIAAVAGELRTAINNSRERRREARERMQPALGALEERRRAQVKLARQTSGLYWGNYNAVCQSYDAARNAAIKRGGTLKPRGGSAGRITNQIQGGTTWEEMTSGACSQVGIAPGPQGRRHWLLTATIYTGRNPDGSRRRRTVTWPIVFHRPLPADARVQEVVVGRRLVAGAWSWTVTFKCRVPAQESGRSAACGIDIGWRQMDHGIRVAMLASGQGTEEIQLPQPIVDRLLRYHDLSSARHQARHEMLLRLNAIAWERAPASLADRARAVLAERDDKGNPSASGLALRGLIAAWALWPRFLPDAYAEAADWATEDRRLWLSAHGRQRAMRARREHYRIAAKGIVERFGVIGIEKVDWAAMASAAREKLPALARRMRVVAAPQELRMAIESAARREGARVHRHSGRSSFLCADCGHETAVNDRAALHFTCGHCSRVHDQDTNAARVLLAAARASAPEEAETPLPLAWQKRLASKMKRRQDEAKGERGGVAKEERSQ